MQGLFKSSKHPTQLWLETEAEWNPLHQTRKRLSLDRGFGESSEIVRPVGRAAISRNKRVVAGLRRAKREGKQLGRPKVIVDREKLRAARAAGKSLRQIGEQFGISRTLVMNVLSA